MPKAMCIQNFSYGATGEAFESGVEYDVPAATLKANPNYFEKMAGTAENKMADTSEDKAEAAE
jgi:hypothetical protein